MAMNPRAPGDSYPPSLEVSNPDTDHRVQAVKTYVAKYMNNLEATPVKNFLCPIVFYQGKETICDYLNRTESDIVVQSGGWVGKYYPLLSSSAYKMLFDPSYFVNPE